MATERCTGATRETALVWAEGRTTERGPYTLGLFPPWEVTVVSMSHGNGGRIIPLMLKTEAWGHMAVGALGEPEGPAPQKQVSACLSRAGVHVRPRNVPTSHLIWVSCSTLQYLLPACGFHVFCPGPFSNV